MFKYFLGQSPKWFKMTIIIFLIFNIFSFYSLGPTVTAWIFIAEFIFTLAMALKCYPLQSGGILAIEALFLKLTTPENAYHEVDQNLEVILLLVFMVASNRFYATIRKTISIFNKCPSSIYDLQIDWPFGATKYTTPAFF